MFGENFQVVEVQLRQLEQLMLKRNTVPRSQREYVGQIKNFRFRLAFKPQEKKKNKHLAVHHVMMKRDLFWQIIALEIPLLPE